MKNLYARLSFFLAVAVFFSCTNHHPHEKREALVAEYLSSQLAAPPQKWLLRAFEGYKWHLPQLESIQAYRDASENEGHHCFVAYQTYVWCENDAQHMLKGLVAHYGLGNPNSASGEMNWDEWLKLLEYGLHINMYGSNFHPQFLPLIPKDIRTQLHYPRITTEAGPSWKTKIEFNYLAKGPAPHRAVVSLNTMEIVINGSFEDVKIHSELLHTF